MADMSKEQRIRALKEEMQRDRGYASPPWDFLIEKDVDFVEAYNKLYKMGLTDGKALPAKTRELIAIALLAFRMQENAVYEHCKRALRLGATKQELIEAMETAVIPSGAPTLSICLRALMRIEAEEKKAK